MAINQQTSEAKTDLPDRARVWTVANLLTALRILLILPFLYFVYAQRFGLALAVFFVASITDYADGYIARNFNQKTRLGQVLDPLADKLLTTASFIVMALPHEGIELAPRLARRGGHLARLVDSHRLVRRQSNYRLHGVQTDRVGKDQHVFGAWDDSLLSTLSYNGRAAVSVAVLLRPGAGVGRSIGHRLRHSRRANTEGSQKDWRVELGHKIRGAHYNRGRHYRRGGV